MNKSIELDDILEQIIHLSKNGETCLTFESVWNHYMNLSEQDKEYIGKEFYYKTTNIPITTNLQVYGYKALIKRLLLEKKRSKKTTKSIDSMIDELSENIRIHRNTLRKKSFVDITQGFEWFVFYTNSLNDNFKRIDSILQKTMLSRHKLSVNEGDVWRNVKTNDLITVKDVVEYYDDNNFKHYFIVYTNDVNPRNMIINAKKFRAEYDLHLLDLEYFNDIFGYDESECTC